MENSFFRFRISFFLYSGIDLWIEIPMELYQRVCDSIGSSKMERLEFGFKFADIVKKRFPELDAFILQEIDKWKSEHFGVNVPDEVVYQYGLTSPWFDNQESTRTER